MDVTKKVKKNIKDIQDVKKQLKKIMIFLEMASPVNPLNWEIFREDEKKIIEKLMSTAPAGLSTMQMGKILNIENSESARVMAWRRVRQIEKKSKALKGIPIVVYEEGVWSLNTVDYTFIIPGKEKVDGFGANY